MESLQYLTFEELSFFYHRVMNRFISKNYIKLLMISESLNSEMDVKYIAFNIFYFLFYILKKNYDINQLSSTN